MFVSWNWLSQYVTLDMTPEALADRLMMAGLNHEATSRVGDDWAIHLEVTSNRPDCLGHLGIAREIAVLFDRSLAIPAAAPTAKGPPASELTSVRVDNLDQCLRYTARVIRGVQVKPSPKWLVDRLATIGIAAINNIVDITNYVLMECGQPLHAFDLAQLKGHQIIVRRGRPGETFVAINHKTYALDESVCVIADADRAVGLGGVMGGAETEVSAKTRDLLIESAEFDPMCIRSTARKLSLHSDSSYRFERGLDPQGIDWASRRCCELILELAGGELATGVIDVGRQPIPREPIALRFHQLPRVLGIDVPREEVLKILIALGNQQQHADKQRVEVIPPSWRRDLTREIDLVEEVARIHGYDQIPEDVSVPMATSHRTRADRVLSQIRHVLTAAGFDEAMTLSAVDESLSDAFSPWTDAAPLVAAMPVLKRADRLRRSLVPSLLDARHTNESLANSRIELFEIAHVYLPQADKLPSQELMLALTSGSDFFGLKGVIEGLVLALNPAATLDVRQRQQNLFDEQRSVEIHVDSAISGRQLLGCLGEVGRGGLEAFDLRAGSSVAELRCAVLMEIANLIPKYQPAPAFPAITRDLNLVVDEAVTWAEVARTARQASAPYAESLEFQDVYRDEARLGAGKKSLLFRLVLRLPDATLTNEQADEVRNRVVAACQQEHAALLR